MPVSTPPRPLPHTLRREMSLVTFLNNVVHQRNCSNTTINFVYEYIIDVFFHMNTDK